MPSLVQALFPCHSIRHKGSDPWEDTDFCFGAKRTCVWMPAVEPTSTLNKRTSWCLRYLLCHQRMIIESTLEGCSDDEMKHGTCQVVIQCKCVGSTRYIVDDDGCKFSSKHMPKVLYVRRYCPDSIQLFSWVVCLLVIDVSPLLKPLV